jgi:bis(5'-nucleosidyl)-tetraphosphatase
MKFKYRKAVFVVLYKTEKGKVFYLILHRKKHWKGFEFCKGGIEDGETEIDAAKRETYEESGLKIKKIFNNHIHGKYKYPRKFSDRRGFLGQKYSVYSAEVFPGKVKIDKHEHSGFEWLEYKDALEKLSKEDQKKVLRKIVKGGLK